MKKSLKKQLEEAIARTDSWEAKYWNVRSELGKYEEKERQILGMRLSNYERVSEEMLKMNQQMMEIVRWHVNPETAKRAEARTDRFGNPIL